MTKIVISVAYVAFFLMLLAPLSSAHDVSEYGFNELSINEQRAVIELLKVATNETTTPISVFLTTNVMNTYLKIEQHAETHNGGSPYEMWEHIRVGLLQETLYTLEDVEAANEILPLNEFKNLSFDERESLRKMVNDIYIDRDKTEIRINTENESQRVRSTYQKLLNNAEKRGGRNNRTRDSKLQGMLTAIAERETSEIMRTPPNMSVTVHPKKAAEGVRWTTFTINVSNPLPTEQTYTVVWADLNEEDDHTRGNFTMVVGANSEVSKDVEYLQDSISNKNIKVELWDVNRISKLSERTVGFENPNMWGEREVPSTRSKTNKKTAGFEIFFAAIAIIIAVASKRNRS